MIGEIIEQNRKFKPLVHCITNYVTANDCANMLLACGGSAIMADDPGEIAEITAICDGLVLNMGTPNPRKIRAMLKAGKMANVLQNPVIFDPVGVGSSGMRRKAAAMLLKKVRFAAIRGNASEISTLVCGTRAHRGVDADAGENGNALENAKVLALKYNTVVIATGDEDIVTDGKNTYRVMNGHSMMRTVTGTGCQMSALIGAYITANPKEPLKAALAAVCAMGLCGELAWERLGPHEGNAGYRNHIIDEIYHLTPETLERGAKYEKC